MATLQLLARCRTSGSGSSLNSAKILLAALGARTVLCCLLILELFPSFQLTCEKHLLLERSIPERRGQNHLSLLCIAQSSFQQQSTPNVVFLTRGFYLGRSDTALHAHIIPNISPFAHYKRRLQRDGFAAGKRAPRRCAPTKAARRICRAGAEGVFRRNAKRRGKRRKRPDFDASSFCREARRHWQNVKDREIDVATGFFAGALPRIRGKASEP